MSIVLVQPPYIISKNNIWRKIDRAVPPLGLAYIGAFLEQKGIEVRILDLQAQHMDVAQYQAYLRQLDPEFLGISATTVEINSALKLAECSRQTCPNAQIIFGGPHPSIMTEEVLAHPTVDFVVRGEGEQTVYELVSATGDVSTILGLSYKQNGVMKHNPPRPLIEDIDEIPIPAYHLLPMDKYKPSLGNYKRLPAVSMITSRGCPGRCTFCYTGIFGKKIRTRSARNLLEEIKYLQKNYGIKEISFYDDTFTAFKDNVKEFCGRIIQERIDITWSCMSRIDCIDEEILKLMKRAGCHQIGYGLESASPEILQNIRKPLALDLAKKVVALTKQAGIDVRGMFMLGNPGETEETLRRTIEFAIELDPDLVIFNITTPYPGTEMYEWAKASGYLKAADWDEYDLSHVVMRLPTVSPERIQYYYHLAYNKFFLRPSYIGKRIRKMKTFVDVKNNATAMLSLLNFKAEGRPHSMKDHQERKW